MRTLRVTIGIISVMMLAQIAAAQMSAEVSVTNMHDDNVNNNAEQWKSNISMLNLSAGYGLEGELSGLSLSYDGSFHYYESMLSRTNQFHSGNVVFLNYSGEENENRLRIAGSYGIGVNRDAYTIFDHTLFSASIEYKHFITERFINTTGYTFRSIAFSSLNDFSYSEHAVFLRGAAAATPTTTVIAQADLGTKYYSTSITESGSSMRKGTMAAILPSVTQAIGMVKIGQGITDQIGVNVTARYQWNIQKQTRYLSSDYGYISDDELFDDHYGYEGLHTSMQYTQLFSESFTGKVTGGIQNRAYSSLAAFDLAGIMVAGQRSDTRTYVNILLDKEYEELGFSIKTSLDMIWNSSNDAFYDYQNTAVTMEIDIPF